MELMSNTSCEDVRVRLQSLLSEHKDKISVNDLTREWIHDFASWICESNSDSEILLALQVVRLMSRDSVCACLISNDDVIRRITKLANLENIHIPSCNISDLVQVESQKCLCNLTFQSSTARNSFVNCGVFSNLIKRVDWLSKDMERLGESFDLDVKLCFVVTALCHNLRKEAMSQGLFISLIRVCQMLTHDSTKHLSRISEILKLAFNLVSSVNLEEAQNQIICDSLGEVCRCLLVIEEDSLTSNCINLMTLLPEEAVTGFVIDNDLENQPYIDIMVKFFETKNDEICDISEKSCLQPVLVVLINMAKCNTARKYIKAKILPALGCEVENRPECGVSLRNKFVRLMTAVSDVNVLAAELLFHICKRNVDRLIKYTGYGNAAGLLLRYGLLAGGTVNNNIDDMSPDENSDTEEYNQLRQTVDPVVGSVVPPRVSPFEGMSEEQKEFEAMKLVEVMQKLMDNGVIKPATVGEDGNIKPMEHVLQMVQQNGEQYEKEDES